MKKFLNNMLIRRTTDILLSPFTLLGAIWYKYIRSASVNKMPLSETIFMRFGLLPVTDHYYQPLINPAKHLAKPLNAERYLPGIDWNIEEQLGLLKQFRFSAELKAIPLEKTNPKEIHYYFNNHSYTGGDGSYLYNIIRHFKPKRIIEIGCGYSTMIAQLAEKKNADENDADKCRHICIEPYEMPWLEKLPVEVIRKKVEDINKETFLQLEKNDILFIDSSHIIRPQGDVLTEILEILPAVKQGVLVHFHDIFTPKDYPKEWVIDKHCFWNEQYLLEAFLSFNKEFRVIGALNYLKHNYLKELAYGCPVIERLKDDEPGSFWITRN